ncbi:Prm10p [Perkinsela sp. CCAP 1560/4]|nr:Prm10p [Perkinsela sp. CCAP 1560/4]|eukprot:KNH06490.1 Prm10p [Perkinsela sp. CCAP 1560/4]
MGGAGKKSTRSKAQSLIKGSSPKKPPFMPLSPRQSSLRTSTGWLEGTEPLNGLSLTESMSRLQVKEGSQRSSECNVTIPRADDASKEKRNRTMQKGNFLIRMAQLYQLYGSPAHQIEESTRRAAEGLGMQLDIKSFPGFMMATFAAQGSNETVFQTTFTGNNLKKLERVDVVARRCAAGQYTGNNLDDGVVELDGIMMAPDPWSLPVLLIMHGISHGLSALCLFDGGWRDAVLSAILGALTGLSTLRIEGIVSPKLEKLNGFFSCVFNSFVVRIVQLHVHPSICFYPSVVSSILGILPGLGITLGAIEVSQSQIVAGTARMVDSFFKTTLIAIGISMGSQIAFHVSKKSAADLVLVEPQTLDRWHSAMVFPILSFSSTFLLNSAASQLPSQIFTSCCGFLVYTACLEMNFSREMTMALSALVVAVVGHLCTLYNRRPSLITVLSGLLLLVPGGMSVRGAARSLVGGEEEGETGSIAISVITVATSISIGVFVANVLVYPGHNLRLEPLGI